MTQKLKFESAWDRTIAEQDREKIKDAFEKVQLKQDESIQSTPLWQAKNYRGELLVAVLIHNVGQKDFSFQNQRTTYLINGKTFAEHVFSTPITIKKQTSMPWTFIFPKGSFASDKPYEDGELNFSL